MIQAAHKCAFNWPANHVWDYRQTVNGLEFNSLPSVKSKACEARPVGETANRVWRRGQKSQGVMPQGFLGTARVGWHFRKEMTEGLFCTLPSFAAQMPPPFTQGRLLNFKPFTVCG